MAARPVSSPAPPETICSFELPIDEGGGRRTQRLGDRIVEVSQPVEHLLVLVGQPAEGSPIVLESIGENDADDPSLLVAEEVVEPVDRAGNSLSTRFVTSASEACDTSPEAVLNAS